MVPLHAEGPAWRGLLGAAIPALLFVLAVPQGSIRTDAHAAVRSHPRPVARIPPANAPLAWFPAFPAPYEGDILRDYVERARPHLEDPRTMYHVSQALEECYTWGTEPDDDELYAGVEVISRVDLREAKRSWAGQALAAPCRGLERYSINPREILALLEEAARQGEPELRDRV